MQLQSLKEQLRNTPARSHLPDNEFANKLKDDLSSLFTKNCSDCNFKNIKAMKGFISQYRLTVRRTVFKSWLDFIDTYKLL